MIAKSSPRYLWPADHQRTGEPIGHRYPPGPAPEQPRRAYPVCVCGAWVLGFTCEFCSRKRP